MTSPKTPTHISVQLPGEPDGDAFASCVLQQEEVVGVDVSVKLLQHQADGGEQCARDVQAIPILA